MINFISSFYSTSCVFFKYISNIPPIGVNKWQKGDNAVATWHVLILQTIKEINDGLSDKFGEVCELEDRNDVAGWLGWFARRPREIFR